MALVGSAGPLLQWSWISSQSGTILSLLVQHIELTAIAVGIGLVISLPLGVAAWRLPARWWVSPGCSTSSPRSP
jgi:ABC-type proline/glycine betaine transport system permease subunit